MEIVETEGTINNNVIVFKERLSQWDAMIEDLKETFVSTLSENGMKDDDIQFVMEVIDKLDIGYEIIISSKNDSYSKFNHKAKKAFWKFLINTPIERIHKIKTIEFTKFENCRVPLNYLTALLRNKTQEEIQSENYRKIVSDQFNDIKTTVLEFVKTDSKDYDDLKYLITAKFLKIQKDITAMKLTEEAKSKLKTKCYQEQIRFNEWVKVKQAEGEPQ